ncbi:MAG: hypothetical protein PVG24_09970 [Gammaproteobacteria bacterium]|jgi:hypothetical protein
MRAYIAAVAVIGVFASGLEGAVDAANASHTAGDVLAHEMHESHFGHQDESVPARESGPHHHICHCSVHIPPLAFGLIFDAPALTYARSVLIPRSHTYVGGPPPLPPPIA